MVEIMIHDTPQQPEESSFSQLLEKMLTSKVPVSQNEADFLCEITEAKKWLERVFDDPNLHMLGYVGHKSYLEGKGSLELYCEISGLFFGLELSYMVDLSEKTFRFRLAYLQKVANQNDRISCFKRLEAICKENKDHGNYLRQSFIDFNYGDEFVEFLRQTLAAATYNVLRLKPELKTPEAADRIRKELFERKGFVPFEADTSNSPDAVASAINPFFEGTETEYFAAINMKTYLEFATKNKLLQRCLDEMKIGPESLLRHTPEMLEPKHRQSVVCELAKLDIELAPGDGTRRLAPGTPKSVNRLLYYSSGPPSNSIAMNALMRAGIYSTRILITKTPSQLLKTTGFGPKSLQTVQAELAVFDLSLREE